MSRHAERLDQLRRVLGQEGLDAFLVAEPANVTYLSGFSGDSTWLLVAADHAWLITDGRFTEQAAAEAPQCEVVRHKVSLVKSTAELFAASGARALGFSPAELSCATYGELAGALDGVEPTPKKGLVEKLREVKDEDEIGRIRRAAEVADAAFRTACASLAAGQTEADVANRLDYEMRRLGAHKPCFDTIVAARQRSSLPHAQATRAVVEQGDALLIDWGCERDLYCSDCTRVVFLGPPDARWGEIYGIVREAQAKGVAAVRPGAALKEVDAAARGHIAAAGYGEQFAHGLGHGVGLRVHEGPTMNARAEAALAEGMVVTVEPGIYIPGWGGVRIEDTVVVRKDGPEVLTSLPKDLDAAIL